MPHRDARTRIVVCLMFALTVLAGCQDSSGLVGPDVKPSFQEGGELDGGFILDVDPEMMREPFFFEVPGGVPQYAYVTNVRSEEESGIALAETFNQSTYVHLLCMEPGAAWVKVRTGNGYWKIYSLICVDPGVPV